MKYVLSVLISIIAFGAGCAQPSQKALSQDNESGIVENGYKVMLSEPPTIVRQFKISAPTDEIMTGKDLPIDPKDPNIVYVSFVQAGKNYDYTRAITKLYSYNLVSKNLELLYATTVSDTVFHTIGREGSKILFGSTKKGGENSPGPCVSPWTQGSFKYFDLADPKSGLHDYKVPSAKLMQEKEREDACENSETKELL